MLRRFECEQDSKQKRAQKSVYFWKFSVFALPFFLRTSENGSNFHSMLDLTSE